MKRAISPLLVGVAGFVMAGESAQASTITVANSSFEANSNGGVGYGNISGWVSSTGGSGTGTNTNAQPFLNQPAHDGNQAAFIQTEGASLSQGLSGFDPTRQYTVTYWASARDTRATSTRVSLDGGSTSFTTDPGSIARTDKFQRVVSGPLSVSGANSTLVISEVAEGGGQDDTLLIDSVSVSRAVPVVLDGGFESPIMAGTGGSGYELGAGGGNGFNAGLNPNSAWTFGDLSGVARNGSDFGAPSAPEGSQVGILRSSIFSIIQDISGFEAGVTYSLSFEAAGRGGQFGPNEFQVLLDGELLEFGLDTTITPGGTFQTYTTNPFITTGGTFTLEFDGLTGGDRTTFIDDVRFNFVAEATAIPEPSSLLVGLLGVGGLVVRRRRRRS